MSPRPGPRRHRRASAPLVPATAPRRQPLPAGQLRALALTHLRAHPELDFSPAELANALGRPTSRGAIIRSCYQFAACGLAVRTQDRPQRYRATAATAEPHPAATPAQRRGSTAGPDLHDGPRPVDTTP